MCMTRKIPKSIYKSYFHTTAIQLRVYSILFILIRILCGKWQQDRTLIDKEIVIFCPGFTSYDALSIYLCALSEE
jgi:hypothetical protein